jgi:WD40 repeat protein
MAILSPQGEPGFEKCQAATPWARGIVLILAIGVAGCGARPLSREPEVSPPPVRPGDVVHAGSAPAIAFPDAGPPAAKMPVETTETGSVADAAVLDRVEAEPLAGPEAMAPSQDSGAASTPSAESGPPGRCERGVTLSDSLVLAPAPKGQGYLRCGTLGRDGDWTVKISPTGARLAAITGAGTLRLLATDSWVQIAQLASPVGRIDAAEFSADGVHLATLSAEGGQVALWRASDGTLERSVLTSPPPVTDYWGSALAFSTDGTRLATSLGIIIDVSSGGQTPLVLTGPDGRYVSVVDLRFAAHDATLLVQGIYRVGHSPPSRHVSVYDLATKTETVLFDAWDFVPGSGGVALSPDGSVIALANSPCCAPQVLSFFDARSGARVGGQDNWTGRVQAFTPDGRGLIADDTHTLLVRDLATATIGTSWTYPIGTTFAGAGPDGTLVTTGGGETFAWNLNTRAASWALHSEVTGVEWTADGSLAVGGSIGNGGSPADNPVFRLFNSADGTQLCAPPGPGSTASITAAALAADGQTIALGRSDGAVDLWSGDLLRRRGVWPTSAATIREISLAGDGSRMATRDSSAIEIRDTAQGQLLGTMKGPGDGPSDMGAFALSGRGNLLALAHEHSLSVLDVASGAPVFAFSDPSRYVSGPIFSPDDMSVGFEVDPLTGAVRTWRIADGSDHTWYPPTDRIAVDNVMLSRDWSVVVGESSTTGWSAWRTVDSRAIASSGTVPDGNVVLSSDGAVVALSSETAHEHGNSYFSLQLFDVGTGALRRSFWLSAYWASPPALLWPHGERLLTLEGPTAALWCK